MRDKFDIDHPRHWKYLSSVFLPNFQATLNPDTVSEFPCDIDECGCAPIYFHSYRSRGDRSERLRYLDETNRWSSHEGKMTYRFYWPRSYHWGNHPVNDVYPWKWYWDIDAGRQYWLPGVHKDKHKQRTIFRNRDRKRKREFMMEGWSING